jgi:hypothetical protein
MSSGFRLSEEDMLDEQHFPVIAVLSTIRDESFVEYIQFISKGRGFGVDYGACTFPSDLDEYDIASGGYFEGVEFALHNGGVVIVDYQTLYHYLKSACDNHISEYHCDAGALNAALEEYYKSFIQPPINDT